MSEINKKAPEQDQIDTQTPVAYLDNLPTENEAEIKDINDRVVFSTTFVEDIDLLAANSLEYQQIMAFHSGLLKADSSTFELARINALNFIMECPDLYKKQFSLPDRLVSLPVDCGKDGTYYLSLSNGYLCFFKNPQVRGVSFWLADKPKSPDQPKTPIRQAS